MRFLSTASLAVLSAACFAQPMQLNWLRDTAGSPMGLVATQNGDGVYVVKENGGVIRYDRYGSVAWNITLALTDTDDVAMLSDGSIGVVGTMPFGGRTRMAVQEVLPNGTMLAPIIDNGAGAYDSAGRFISGSQLGTASNRRPRFIATGKRTGDDQGYVVALRAPTPDGNLTSFRHVPAGDSFGNGGPCIADRNGDFWYLVRRNVNQYIFGRATKTNVSTHTLDGLEAYDASQPARFLMELSGPVGSPSQFVILRSNQTVGWQMRRIFVNRSSNAITQLQLINTMSSRLLNARVDGGRIHVGFRVENTGATQIGSYGMNGSLLHVSNMGVWGTTSAYMAYNIGGGELFGAVTIPPGNTSNRLYSFLTGNLQQSIPTSGGITRGLEATSPHEVYLLADAPSGTALRKFNRLVTQQITAPTSVYAGQQFPIRVYANGLASTPTMVDLSSNTAALVPPLTLTLARGFGFTNGIVSTNNVGVPTTGQISASVDGGPVISASVTILPNSPRSVRFENSTVQGGTNSNFNITLQAPAAGGGLDVNLASNKPAVVAVPASTNFTQGMSQKTVVLATSTVMTPVTVVVSANKNGVTRAASLLVTP